MVGYQIHVSGTIPSLDKRLSIVVYTDDTEQNTRAVSRIFKERFPECVIALWLETETTSLEVLEHNEPPSKFPHAMPGFVG